MARFTQYPAATSPTDYTEATNFLIEAPDGTIKLGNLSDMKSALFCDVNCASLTIASADVLQLNSTPLTIVAAQGAGTVIEVISASLKLDFNSVAYATNTQLQLLINGAAQYQIAFNNAVLSTSSDTFNSVGKLALAGTNIVENADLQVTVGTGDPTAGDSDITINVLYRIIAV
jgi:hypothetical protein